LPLKRSDAARVARELLARADERHYLYPLGKLCGLRLLHVRRVLDRFLAVGWIEDGWEDPAKSAPNPPRRYYVATELGRREMPSVLRPDA
jgi:hypothetical protein